MSRTIARNALDQLSGRAALIAPVYAGWTPDGGAEVTSSALLGDLRELMSVDLKSSADMWQERRLEISAMYGGNYADAQEKPFAFSNGKAIIPIHGMLLNRFSWSWSFATGYNFIRDQLAAAMADPDVDGIVYDVNSYGGLAAGCIETSDAMFYASSRFEGGKPSIAVVDANCYSAAYMTACSADRVVVTQSGMAGSIGVVIMHMDVSKMMDKVGITTTFVFAGKNKVQGNAYEALGADAKDRFQVLVDANYDTFVGAVVRGRPGMDDAAVRATEAGCFLATEALSLGLIDAIQSPDDAVEGFFNGDLSAVEDDTDGEIPDEDDEPELENNMPGATPIKPAAVATPKADAELLATQQHEANVAAVNAAATAERTRIKGIQSHPEAVGRTSLANHLAHDTSMSVEEAGAVMAAAAKDAPAVVATTTETKTETNHFKNAMDAGKQPNVGAGGEGTGGGTEAENLTPGQRMLQAQQRATGVKPRTAEQRRFN